MLYETQRLTVRRYQEEDADALFAMLSDAETVFFEPYGTHSAAQCRAEAKRRAGDPAFFAVCRRDTGEMIGTVYLGTQDCDGYEMGYVFNRAHWGKGFACEAARGALQYAFEQLGAHRVCAYAARKNERSWRLLERAGMRREGLFLQNVAFKKDAAGAWIWLDSYAYALLASEYKGEK